MYGKPQVNFKVKSLEDQIDIVTSFLETDEDLKTMFGSGVALRFNIDLKKLQGKSKEDRKKIISETVTPIYNSKLTDMQNRINEYQEFWNKNAQLVANEFQKIFKIGFNGIRQFTAEINLNSVCPRYLNSDSFDVNFRKTAEETFATCIHELVHFYWFQVWKEVFDDANDETFETPHLEWLFSEIAVDPIIYFSGLKPVCDEKPAYNYFYTTKFNDETVIELFRKLYRSNSLEKFMEKGIKLLKDNPEQSKNLIR